MKHIGQNIRQLRHKNRMTQNQAAHSLNISIPAFSKIETGITDFNIRRLHQIAELFQVSVTQILFEGGSEPEAVHEENVETLKIRLSEIDQEILNLQIKLIDLYEELRNKNKSSEI